MKNIKQIPIEELVKAIIKANSIIEETKASLSVLKDEVKDRLRERKLSGTKVNGYYVSRVKRISFPEITLKQAEEYGAVVKKKDENKLRILYKKGAKIKARITEFITIKEVKK